MTYGELSEAQAKRSRQFAEAQTSAMSVYCDAERDLKELQAENAKLRELVEDMLDCIEIRMAFGKPPTSEMYENFAQCARELGIEVDE